MYDSSKWQVNKPGFEDSVNDISVTGRWFDNGRTGSSVLVDVWEPGGVHSRPVFCADGNAKIRAGQRRFSTHGSDSRSSKDFIDRRDMYGGLCLG